MDQRKNDFVTRYRKEVDKALSAIPGVLALLDTEYDALDYSNQLVDGDLGPPNDDITAAEFKDGVAALRTVRTTVETHKTNLFRLRRESW